MKNSAKILTLAAFVGACAAPSFADHVIGTIRMPRTANYFSGSGGEFTMEQGTTISPFLNLDAYSPKTKNQDAQPAKLDFQTFCVELTEHTVSPVSMWISTTAVGGGPGSRAVFGGTNELPIPPSGTAYNSGDGDDLDTRTAFLYDKWARGLLGPASGTGYAYLGYNYTPGAGRTASAAALQNAIWYLEGEITTLPAGQATALYNYAVDATTVGNATDEWVGMGLGGVRILNMWGVSGGQVSGNHYQDQLYLIPVPGAALLGAIGLAAIAWVRRRTAAAA